MTKFGQRISSKGGSTGIIIITLTAMFIIIIIISRMISILILAVLETKTETEGEPAKQAKSRRVMDGNGIIGLYKHEDAVRATEGSSGRIAVAVAVVGAGALGDGDDELALGVGGGGHGGARAGREAEPPAVELEGGACPIVVVVDAEGQAPDDDLGDPRVDLDGVRAGATRGGEGEPVDVDDGGGDEPQRCRVLLDGHVRVGRERELQHLGEDVRQPAQSSR